MPRKKKVSIQIVKKPSPVDMKAMLDRAVRDRVDQIMIEREMDKLVDQRPRPISNELRVQQSVFERRKWSLYFEKYGCRDCGRKNKANHASGGTCSQCATRLTGRLARIKRDYDLANPDSQIAEDIDRLSRRYRSAQALLENE